MKKTARQKELIEEWEKHTGFEMRGKTSRRLTIKEMWDDNNRFLENWIYEASNCATLDELLENPR